ncbi:MAG: hypothetical protein R3A11_06450 [Bdellovibrionota bacterium]
MRKLASIVSLFASSGTLLCCALPSLLVLAGAGASVAGLISAFPQITGLSENKSWVFGIGAVMLLVAGGLQWSSRNRMCPSDEQQKEACDTSRKGSMIVYWVSLAFYLVGVFVSFVLPRFV